MPHFASDTDLAFSVSDELAHTYELEFVKTQWEERKFVLAFNHLWEHPSGLFSIPSYTCECVCVCVCVPHTAIPFQFSFSIFLKIKIIFYQKYMYAY